MEMYAQRLCCILFSTAVQEVEEIYISKMDVAISNKGGLGYGACIVIGSLSFYTAVIIQENEFPETDDAAPGICDVPHIAQIPEYQVHQVENVVIRGISLNLG